MNSPATLRELEDDLRAALDRYQAAIRHVRWLGQSGRPGIRHARNRVARLHREALQAEVTRDAARMGMGL